MHKTVWREAAVGVHLRARNEMLAALNPEHAALPQSVFCWETVLKVHHHLLAAAGCDHTALVLPVLPICPYSGYQKGTSCRGDVLARRSLLRTPYSGGLHLSCPDW